MFLDIAIDDCISKLTIRSTAQLQTGEITSKHGMQQPHHAPMEHYVRGLGPNDSSESSMKTVPAIGVS